MKPLKAIARRALDAAKVFLSFSAREILRREPVITGGLLVSVGLAVAAWFGFHPSSESQQVWQTVAAALAPTVTALLASMATWSPAGHAEAIASGAHVQAPPVSAMFTVTTVPPQTTVNTTSSSGAPPPAPAAPAKKAPAKRKPAAKKAAAKKKP